MKKIVLLKSFAKNMGGLEKTTARIASAFLEKGANVSILTTKKKNARPFAPLSDRIAVHAVQTLSWPSFLRIQHFDKQVQKWLQENPTDIVLGLDRTTEQTHMRAGNGVHLAYLKSRILTEGTLKYKSCLVNPLHRSILHLEKKAFENPQLKKVFANSHKVKEEILAYFSIDPSKIVVLHNGVEWDEMKEDFTHWQEEKPKHCNRLHLDPEKLHLLFIGHGYLRKGLRPLLQALALLQRKDVHLSVVGKDAQQWLYEAEAIQLGLGSQVRFFGPQKDVRPFYQIADALVIPSFYDPFANVTNEALAMGLFVLSSKCNGGSEVLTPQTGTIIEELQNMDSFVTALKTALRPKTMKEALLRRNSVEHLNYQQQMNKLVELSFA